MFDDNRRSFFKAVLLAIGMAIGLGGPLYRPKRFTVRDKETDISRLELITSPLKDEKSGDSLKMVNIEPDFPWLAYGFLENKDRTNAKIVSVGLVALLDEQYFITAGHVVAPNGRPIRDSNIVYYHPYNNSFSKGKILAYTAKRNFYTPDLAIGKLDTPMIGHPVRHISQRVPVQGDKIFTVAYTNIAAARSYFPNVYKLLRDNNHVGKRNNEKNLRLVRKFGWKNKFYPVYTDQLKLIDGVTNKVTKLNFGKGNKYDYWLQTYASHGQSGLMLYDHNNNISGLASAIIRIGNNLQPITLVTGANGMQEIMGRYKHACRR
ncbi:MAG: hypothetical protein ABIC04_01035 [Nanoarchaeota archaeon]